MSSLLTSRINRYSKVAWLNSLLGDYSKVKGITIQELKKKQLCEIVFGGNKAGMLIISDLQEDICG